MYKKVLMALSLCVSANVLAANKPFTLQVEHGKNGGFTKEQTLSAPYGFGCSGGNISPAISWKNAPKGTKSFVLNIHDKDAPTGLGWVHWVVVNIPADATSIPAGVDKQNKNLPMGALQTRTDFGEPGYGGACPPEGRTHNYEFTLTALKVDKLPLTADATPALVGFMAKANALAEAKVVITHQR